MLTELHTLLRSSTNSQRLRRPKLLTNINIIPNEWNIYPPKRLNNNEDIRLEGDVKNGGENETTNLLNISSIDNITRWILKFLILLLRFCIFSIFSQNLLLLFKQIIYC
ncbi:unnamed protein product [Meloidogyne enterolobii]|uniref:Uncharacterized protein n=1 Tax=Meloidogyne enterolobii TaxID=390850 RepID=A0ACB0YE81_MELEN